MTTGIFNNLLVSLKNQLEFLEESNYSSFHYRLKSFQEFLDSRLEIQEIFNSIKIKFPASEQDVQRFIQSKIPKPIYKSLNTMLSFTSYEDCVVKSFFVIKKLTEMEVSYHSYIDLMSGYLAKNAEEAIEKFIKEFVKPVIRYIEEKLEQSTIILNFLISYKWRSEWFHRTNLSEMANKGEKVLVKDLYEYLFDRGVEFNIESWSGSGEADIVASQSGNERFVADAKIFDKAKGIGYLAHAFNQIYTYTNDYNQSFGYIVIYKTCEEDLDLFLSGQTLTIPFVEHNNKIIYLLTIDIFPHKNTASKRGKLKKISVTKEDLINSLDEVN